MRHHIPNERSAARLIGRVALILLSILGPGFVSGSLYFVATNGNDLHNGLLPSYLGETNGPFRTLGRAAQALKPGDTLEIRGGTYAEKIDFGNSGTAAERITITNYDRETVIIDGQDRLPGGSVFMFLVKVSGAYVTIRNVTIKDSSGSLLALTGDYSAAVNVRGEGSRETGMIAIGRHNLFDGCVMTDSGNGYGLDGQQTWGSAIGSRGSSTIMQNCLAYDNRGEGFNAGWAATDAVIQDCVAYNNGALNVYNDSARGTIIRRNLIYCTPGARFGPRAGIVIGAEAGPPSNLQIVNNLCLGNWINLVTDSNVTVADNFLIAHNTFVNSRKTAADISSGYDMGVYFRPQLASSINSRFENNIVIEEGAGQIPINTTLAGAPAGWIFANNGWNKKPASAASGLGDVVADPGLARTGATDAGALSPAWFRISGDSPVVDKGIPLNEVREDFFGTPRGGAPDIGAHEYSGGTSSTVGLTIAVETGAPAMGSGGTSDPPPGEYAYPRGTVISAKALAHADYRFSRWTGDLPGGAVFLPDLSLLLDTGKSVSATFCTKCADVNGDLRITPGDAQMVFDIYLGRIAAPAWCQAENSDVNGDGGPSSPRVTPADAQSIFLSYLGGGTVRGDCSGDSRLAARAERQWGEPGGSLKILEARPLPGQDIAVPIFVESPTDIGAFGLEVVFPPECYTFVAVERADLTRDFDQLEAAVISPGANVGVQGRRAAARGLLRIGGYTTDSRNRSSAGVLVTLVFRRVEGCRDSVPLTIVAAYDDLQGASFGLDTPFRVRRPGQEGTRRSLPRRRS